MAAQYRAVAFFAMSTATGHHRWASAHATAALQENHARHAHGSFPTTGIVTHDDGRNSLR
jgi:hypothetical protein